MPPSPSFATTWYEPIVLPITTRSRRERHRSGQSIRRSSAARPSSSGLGVQRQQSEGLAAGALQGPEMTLVGAQELERPVTVGQYHDGRISESDPQIGVAIHDPPRLADV